MPLNPRFFEMGAKTWRDPLTHQKWIEEEKLRLQAAKHKVAEEKLAKEVENASSKLAQKEIAEKGRLIDEQKKDEYLARLKADVARLEAKQTGKVQDPLKDILEYDEERVVTQGDQREKELEKEVQLTAAEMLKLREKELEEKKKRQEKEMADLADRRRRELLEYKHALGLSHDHQRPQRPPLVSRRPLSLHDDPEFWKLDDSDRHRLELIHPDERIQYGFGPYEEDEIERECGALAARQLVQKMKEFVCTEETHVAGLTKIFEPISHAVPLDLPDLATLTPQDQQQAELTIQEEAQLLQDELVRFAIQQYGANALLSFQIDGPLPVEDPPLQQEGWIYELRANGIPALVAKAKPQSRAGYGAFPSQHNKPAGRIPRSRYPQDGGLAGRRFGDSPLFGLEDDFLAGLGRGTHGASAGYVGSLGIGGAPARRGVAGTGWKQPAADWGGGGSLFGRGASMMIATLGTCYAIIDDTRLVDHDFGLFDDPLAAQSRFSTAAAQPALPAHLKNLPWAAQQYVKRMRALQEQEEAEALARAAVQQQVLVSRVSLLHATNRCHSPFTTPHDLP
ncbi:hypothetical protein JCM10295v2_005912 [Rhodotorula toruloides]